jgi:hypothetical protein
MLQPHIFRHVDVDTFLQDSTGGTPCPSRIVRVPFDRFEVTLRLGPANEFLEVLEVATRRDFLSTEQRIRSTGYHDVADLYER